MSYSLAVSNLLSPITGDAETADAFSAENDLAAMMAFELSLLTTQEKCGRIPKGTCKRIQKALQNFQIDPESTGLAIAQDGVSIPSLVAALRKAVPAADAKYIHQDATSQDAIDTSFMMRASLAMTSVLDRLIAIADRLGELHKAYDKKQLLGRTRMQAALPMLAKARIDAWENNVATATIQVNELIFPLQFFGPIGTNSDEKVISLLAKELGLTPVSRSWQNDRGPVLAIGNACAGVSGALGKIGADVALMAQNEVGEIRFSRGGRSSAMPHKQNPVKAEVLVSLARYNASLLSALHNAAVHEQERSGAAWTLEWLVMPQMICNAGASVRLAGELLNSIVDIGK